MNKCTLGVHQIKFVIQTSPSFSNGCSVAQHANRPLNFRQVSTRNNRGWLVVDSHFKPCWTPIHELK